MRKPTWETPMLWAAPSEDRTLKQLAQLQVRGAEACAAAWTCQKSKDANNRTPPKIRSTAVKAPRKSPIASKHTQ